MVFSVEYVLYLDTSSKSFSSSFFSSFLPFFIFLSLFLCFVFPSLYKTGLFFDGDTTESASGFAGGKTNKVYYSTQLMWTILSSVFYFILQ